MRLFKRANGIYYVELKHNQKQSLHTKDKSIAQTAFNRLKRGVLSGKLTELSSKGSTITLEQFKKDYIKIVSSTKEASSERSDDLSFRKFIDNVGNKALRNITSKDISTFHSDVLASGASKSTVNTYIRRLKAAFNKAVDWKYLSENPYLKHKQYKEDEKIPRYLEIKEVAVLFKAITDPDFSTMVYTYILTGCRRAELVRLRWEHIKEDYIIIVKTKTHAERTVTISEELKAILKPIKRNIGFVFPRWRSPDAISRKFHGYVKDAKIPNIRLHDLRHTTASYLAMSGETLDNIANILGHSDKRTTKIYAHLSPAYQKKAMDKIGPALGLSRKILRSIK